MVTIAAIPDLDAIVINTPCQMPWDAMKGDDRTRFCAHCRLNVYDLSTMTKSEAQELIVAREGRLCVRIWRRADGTVITNDCAPIRAKRVRQAAARAILAAAALLITGLAAAGITSRISSQDAAAVARRIKPLRALAQAIEGQVSLPPNHQMGKVVMGDVAMGVVAIPVPGPKPPNPGSATGTP